MFDVSYPEETPIILIVHQVQGKLMHQFHLLKQLYCFFLKFFPIYFLLPDYLIVHLHLIYQNNQLFLSYLNEKQIFHVQYLFSNLLFFFHLLFLFNRRDLQGHQSRLLPPLLPLPRVGQLLLQHHHLGHQKQQQPKLLLNRASQ